MKKQQRKPRPNQKVKQKRRKYSTKKTAGYQAGSTYRENASFVSRAMYEYFSDQLEPGRG